VKRVTILVIALMLIALPLLPAPRMCHRMPACAAMNPSCPMTSVRVPPPRTAIRVNVSSPASAPRLLPKVPVAVERVVYACAARDHFWIALATTQLRI
jgi:hypothetical protein